MVYCLVLILFSMFKRLSMKSSQMNRLDRKSLLQQISATNSLNRPFPERSIGNVQYNKHWLGQTMRYGFLLLLSFSNLKSYLSILSEDI